MNRDRILSDRRPDGVAQVFNLPYRRRAAGGAWEIPVAREMSSIAQVENLRYGRLKTCATRVAASPRCAMAPTASARRSQIGNLRYSRLPVCATSLRGFTLIELLVVISIIAVLAALVIGIYPAAHRKKVQARVSVELNNLANVIEVYKADENFYPPDNTADPGRLPNQPPQPPLAYELTGTTLNNTLFTTLEGAHSISANDVMTYFNRDGFANSGEPGSEKAKNYYGNLKESSVGIIPGSQGVRVLVAPYKGLNGDFNPYHYQSTNPEHNTESFDLWAVIVINGQTYTNGNWKD